jgi:signal transduction histidine kinase
LGSSPNTSKILNFLDIAMCIQHISVNRGRLSALPPAQNLLLKTLAMAIIALLLFGSPVALAEVSPKKLTLQLLWHHQFEFAGYYAALNKGFYADAGLDVTLKEGGPNISPIDEVTQGRSDFGVSTSGLVKSYLEGKPVLMLAPIFQHSPVVLLSHGKKLKTPADVAKAGAIGLQPGDEGLDLKAMFVNEGIALDKLAINTDAHGLEDLLSGKIVAMNAYLSNEPYWLEKRGIAYSIIEPANYGMDFYNDILFTHSATAKAQPEVVASFRAATLKGWEYALAHQNEIIGLILAEYNTQGKSRDHLLFEAKTLTDLIDADMVELGHSNPWRWRHIAETYAQFGMMKSGLNLDGFFYDPNPPAADMAWLYRSSAIGLLLMVIITAIATYLYRINRKLQHARKIAEQALAEQRQFVAMVSHEFRSPLAVIDAAAQVLNIQLLAGSESIAVLARIRRGVSRLTRFLDNCLTEDRLDSSGLSMHVSAIDIYQLAVAQQETMQQVSAEHHIVTELEAGLPTLEADPQLLNIMLTNLLCNAIKYSPAGSEVKLCIKQLSANCIFEVIDQGPGIAADERALIFQKYQRGRASKDTAGAGLGLSLVARIVKLHAGSIDIKSHKGEGAQFVVSIPLIQAANSLNVATMPRLFKPVRHWFVKS